MKFVSSDLGCWTDVEVMMFRGVWILRVPMPGDEFPVVCVEKSVNVGIDLKIPAMFARATRKFCQEITLFDNDSERRAPPDPNR